jgi:hypothetical protein
MKIYGQVSGKSRIFSFFSTNRGSYDIMSKNMVKLEGLQVTGGALHAGLVKLHGSKHTLASVHQHPHPHSHTHARTH